MKNKKIYLFISLVSALLLFCFFLPKFDAKEVIPVMKGTSLETEILIIEGKETGNTVFVIGGIHGDEISGWKAANDLKKITSLTSGTLVILSPANAPGAKTEDRNTETYRDLNRSFPGEKNRDLTDQLAASIFQAIESYQPDIVLDLHEADREEGNRDFLGNSLIFTDMTGMEELIPEIILETQSGTLCTKAFQYFGPAPRGSLNHEVTQRLQIPVITIEASKEDSLEERISNHSSIIQKIMSYYSVE